MPELRFDIRGNLTPYELVEVPYSVFRETFVDTFDEDSTRHGLWSSFERYLVDFRQQIGELPTQIWVNGSFTTIRQNPQDLDLVVFLNFEMALAYESILRQQFVGIAGEKRYGVDAYLLRIYPQNHSESFRTVSDLAYWRDWFGTTRKGRSGKRFAKGFVQLTF